MGPDRMLIMETLPRQCDTCLGCTPEEPEDDSDDSDGGNSPVMNGAGGGHGRVETDVEIIGGRG